MIERLIDRAIRMLTSWRWRLVASVCRGKGHAAGPRGVCLECAEREWLSRP